MVHLFPLMRPLAYEAMVRAEIGLGRLDRAADCAARASAISDGVPGGWPWVRTECAVARVMRARGDLAGAAARALAAASAADALQARVEAGRSRLLAGRCLAAAGEREQAGAHLRAAEAQLASCDAMRLREECVRELRRIGLRVTRAGRRGDATQLGPGTLSGREREVADLAGAGHRNREIADRLFLSEKTVESHLRSVFMKLGISSRAHVARALAAPQP